jgi:hypothetical protein
MPLLSAQLPHASIAYLQQKKKEVCVYGEHFMKMWGGRGSEEHVGDEE